MSWPAESDMTGTAYLSHKRSLIGRKALLEAS